MSVKVYRRHDITTCHSTQRVFCGAHHTRGLGTLGADVVPMPNNFCDGRIDLQSLGQGLEAATDQGWCLDFWALPAKPPHLNPENTSHSTETFRISLIKT